jgi:hypothetical protein
MRAVPKIPAQAGIVVVPKPHHKEQPVVARPARASGGVANSRDGSPELSIIDKYIDDHR